MTASNNLSQIGAKYTGTILTNGASAANMAYMTTVSCWGDSLTNGTGGTPYPTALSAITGYNTINNGVGGYTSTQILNLFLAAPTQWPNLTIIWSGRNNYTDTATILANIATMVADIGHDGYLILSVLNGNYVPYEAIGGDGYNLIISLNNQLSAIYGSKYLDVRSILVAAYNPSIPQDVTDHTNDIPPSSLRSDSIHLNTAGYALVASSIKTVIANLRGTRGLPVSTTGVVDLLSAPPQIGVVTPNIGKFTTLTATTLTATTLTATSSIVVASKNISVSGDATSIQFNAALIPQVDATYNLGYGPSTYRWLNGYFSGQLNCASAAVTAAITAATLTATSGTTSPTYTSNYKNYSLAIGASQDLLSVGSYQAAANGFLAIRCIRTGGLTISVFAVSMMGSGTPSIYTPLSTQVYSAGSATFTITETSSGGVNKLTLNNTSGAAITVTVTPHWIYVDSNATVTYF
jgi:lysophospholipase L1-like esterase